MTGLHIHIESKTYPNTTQPVIADFKLSLKHHEFVCLVGPSGCGKTTLLNIVAGLDKHYKGEIHQKKQLTPPKIGYVFQNPRLLPWRTVRENIDLALAKTPSPVNVDHLLDIMQLRKCQQRYPGHLSLGMNRRVSIIRAFAVDPDLLLMDEPFVSLDAPTARQIRELLQQLWLQRPHTVLFVTHDLREAIALADRLVFLSAYPMQVLTEINVPIPRQQRNNEAVIEAFRQELILNQPGIKALL